MPDLATTQIYEHLFTPHMRGKSTRYACRRDRPPMTIATDPKVKDPHDRGQPMAHRCRKVHKQTLDS